MFYDCIRIIFNKTFLFSIILHVLYGCIFEKSKLYYPYTFGRNILFLKTDLYKFYISICFVSLGIPYIVSKILPNQYTLARSYITNRYENHQAMEVQVGSYLLGISMLLTGFCPSYLPIYLAINPVLFLYSIAASYIAFICYHIYEKVVLNRVRLRPIDNERNNTYSITVETESLHTIERIITLSICVILLLMFETIEQSLPVGHTADELHDLIRNGDYLPPGLTGILCGLITTLLIFICHEYQTLTSEWLVNIFYYTSDIATKKTNITGQLCFEQILKMLSIAFGARLSLWLSSEQEIPNIDWLFYPLIGLGSFAGAYSVCLTTATFTDHVYLVHAFVGSVTSDIIPLAIASVWIILYMAQLLKITNLK
ncbi:unnamed protein product [Adineta steineri]|uniref:Uncharacterized protein n=1 Tax=Adineta steineri TaxID=433720 RepID=A0A813ZTG0_9BILA|nr:unnamed protein product [Adineta steineri]CAF3756835.1 unnamed protein product [Adineta steineri]